MNAATARRQVLLFFGITFAITWGISILFFLFPATVLLISLATPDDPWSGWLYYLAVYAPSITATLLLLRLEGRAAFRRAFARATAPGRIGPFLLWFATAFAWLPVGWLICAALAPGLGSADARLLFLVLPITIFGSLYLASDPGPIGEEFGWRGYAMPRLLALMPPLAAGLLLGAIWALWHTPAFLVSQSPQHELSFAQFAVSLTAQGVVLAWLWLRSGGNWFIAGFVPHAVVNGAANLHGFSVDRPIYAIVPVVAACLVALDPVMRRRAPIGQVL